MNIRSGLYKSKHGIRLLIETKNGCADSVFNLISIKSFSDQYKSKVGSIVGSRNLPEDEMKEYLDSRNYVYLGSVKDFDKLIFLHKSYETNLPYSPIKHYNCKCCVCPMMIGISDD